MFYMEINTIRTVCVGDDGNGLIRPMYYTPKPNSFCQTHTQTGQDSCSHRAPVQFAIEFEHFSLSLSETLSQSFSHCLLNKTFVCP